jgi:peptidoglycan/LPS O-acetylase OafA/YrhL
LVGFPEAWSVPKAGGRVSVHGPAIRDRPPRPQSASMAPARARYAFIDTLRGLACLLVVYIHSVQWLHSSPFTVSASAKAWTEWTITAVDPGKVGVLIFFIISGYVVPFTLLRSHPSPVKNFITNRFFRLYPAYWLSLMLAIIAFFHYLGVVNSPSKIAANATMMQSFLGQPHVQNIYWTLEVELIFYTLCVMLFIVGGMRYVWAPSLLSLGFLIAALGVASARHLLGIPLPVGLPLALSLMFFGFAVRQLSSHGTPFLRRSVYGLITFYAFALPAVCYIGYAGVPADYGSWNAYLWSYYIAIAVFCAVVLIWPLSTSASAWIGRISYSVYLFHLICINVIGYYLVELLPPSAPGLPVLIVFPVATLLVAHVLFVYVEQPSIRLGRAINSRLGWSAAKSP